MVLGTGGVTLAGGMIVSLVNRGGGGEIQSLGFVFQESGGLVS